MTPAQRPLKDLTVDYGTRPKAPHLPQATDTDRRAGRHLAAIHRHYLMDIAKIAAVMERIAAKDAPPAELEHIVLSMDMAENLRAFGNLCGQECQILTMHHNIEQQSMFPQLEQVGLPGLSAVVARLREEHEVVHELINRLAQAAQNLTRTGADPEFEMASATFKQLRDVVKSHFKYEETELEAAIGFYLGGI